MLQLHYNIASDFISGGSGLILGYRNKEEEEEFM